MHTFFWKIWKKVRKSSSWNKVESSWNLHGKSFEKNKKQNPDYNCGGFHTLNFESKIFWAVLSRFCLTKQGGGGGSGGLTYHVLYSCFHVKNRRSRDIERSYFISKQYSWGDHYERMSPVLIFLLSRSAISDFRSRYSGTIYVIISRHGFRTNFVLALSRKILQFYC